MPNQARQVLIAVLCAAMLVSVVYLAKDIQSFFNANPAPSRHLRFMHATSTPPTVDSIQGWMTFEYLNRVFLLPPEYMKDQLSITDTHYPKLTVDHLAKTMGTDPATLLEQVKILLRNKP